MKMHDWQRYNLEKAIIEHVFFESDENGVVDVTIEVVEQMLTELGFEETK